MKKKLNKCLQQQTILYSAIITIIYLTSIFILVGVYILFNFLSVDLNLGQSVGQITRTAFSGTQMGVENQGHLLGIIFFSLLLAGVSILFFILLRYILSHRATGLEKQIKEKNEDLLSSNNRYITTIDVLEDAVHYIDNNFRIIYFNKALHSWSNVLGISTTEVIGKDLFEVFPFLNQNVRSEYDEVFASGETIITSDTDQINGHPIQVETYKIPILGNGKIVGVITLIRNVSARVQEMEKLLYHSKLLDNIQNHIVAVNLEGEITYVNQVVADLAGLTKAELLGKSALEIARDLEEGGDNIFEDTLTSGVWQGVFSLRFPEKPGVLLDAKTWLMVDENGKPQGIVGASTDITLRKEAEAKVASQIKRLRALRTIDEAIISRYNLEEVMNVLLVQVTELLHVDAACTLLFNPKTRKLENACSRGFKTRALQNVKLKLGKGYAGKAAVDKKVFHYTNISELNNDLMNDPFIKQEKFVDYFGVPLLVKNELVGVLELFHREALNPEIDWLEFLETLGNQAAIAIHNAELFRELQHSNNELSQAYDTTLQGWARALELRDLETEGHSQRVTDMTLQLAVKQGFLDDELLQIKRGALLHDIGKMGIPDSILFKPGPLDAQEWHIMRQHTYYGREMLYPIEFLRPALDIVEYHHEKWDGSGYPNGLAGEEIPLSARIFAVADVWDSLIHERPYKKAWSQETALEYIKSQSGKHFDPDVVELFMQLEILQNQVLKPLQGKSIPLATEAI